jgi:N-acetylglucosamine-6-sulfatase
MGAGLHPGKECGFDTDIHIPLIVRGPGVPRGRVTEQVTSHTDLAPTILGLAGGASREEFDGASITLTLAPVPAPELGLDEQEGMVVRGGGEPSQEHVNIEFWGNVIPEGLWGKYGDGFDPHTGSHLQGLNNTYKAVRIVSPDYSLYYSVWCTGEKEYYDMKVCVSPGHPPLSFA